MPPLTPLDRSRKTYEELRTKLIRSMEGFARRRKEDARYVELLESEFIDWVRRHPDFDEKMIRASGYGDFINWDHKDAQGGEAPLFNNFRRAHAALLEYEKKIKASWTNSD